MNKLDTLSNRIHKILFATFLTLFIFSIASQTYANGRPVATWYKIKGNGISKTVKATTISLTIPGIQSEVKSAKLVLDNRPLNLKLGGGSFKLTITAHGSGIKPTARTATSTTSTTTNGDVTITTTTTIDDDGNSETKTTRTSGSGTTTTTTSTDSSGNTSTKTTSTKK